ncbi:glycosyltransferase family 25 protein [Sphingobacterium bambusae]|uniref:Uncharacterized protein n=1 Tax=Sphingobacterium bambusae TaxID=662858 RepID=A0ABW6BB88_9SPHI|nr:hypothetical protein [Sphingobacterium bambusae]WPL49147.1 hypothetical protein SCB77_01540 [Sphingobacterium bambusae]
MSLSIPVYIINLEKRKDRRSYIENEFYCRSEFDIHIIKAIESSIPAVGLYKSLHYVISVAKQQELPYVLVCEDDHQFTSEYHVDILNGYLERMAKYDADVFAGGVSWFNCALQAEKDLYWIDRFTGAQFLVIYARFYQKILESTFTELDIIDNWISNLSDKVFVAVPMLSVQHDFGYSDVTDKNNVVGRVEKLFSDTMERWKALQNVNDHVQNSITTHYPHDDIGYDMNLPTYIIKQPHSDRIAHINEQFKDKMELDVSFVEMKSGNNQESALWETIHVVIKSAMEKEDDVILICQDHHLFSDRYKKEELLEAIYEGAYLGADLILGGINEVQQIIPVSKNLCWISLFKGAQFTIIYSAFFDTILAASLYDGDLVDSKLSSLSANKYVIHPFISLGEDFKLADTKIDESASSEQLFEFERCESTILKVREISRYLSDMNQVMQQGEGTNNR